MRSVSLVFVLVAVALAMDPQDLTYNTTDNLNLTNAETEFPMRRISVENVVLRGVPYNAYYGTASSLSGSNSVIGSGMLIGNATTAEYSFYLPPATFGFEYKDQNDLSYLDLASMIYRKSDPNNYLFKTLIALTFPGVVELDQQGRYVSFVSFNTSGKTGEYTWSTFTPVQTNEGRLKGWSSTLKGSNNAEFRITMILSEVAGVLNFGYVPVSPKSISYVVEIENWPYKNRLYKLGLIMGTAVKLREGHFKDNFTARVDNNGDVLSYVGMPGYAVVDKQIVSITTIEDASSIIRRTPLVVASDAVQLMEYFLFEDKGHYKFRCAVFPETAQKMIYGTAVGAGDPIYSHIKVPSGTYSSSASSVILSIVAVLVALALIF